jgi:nitrite reductase/ring-hydroxylating ferredoxin subunit
MAWQQQSAMTFLEFSIQLQGDAQDGYVLPEPKPEWDDAAGCFWCPTPVNAYDIPDALEWQEAFRDAVTQQEPDFFTGRPLLQEIQNLSSLPPARHQPSQRLAAKTSGGVKTPCYESPPSSARISSPTRSMASPVTPTKKPTLWGAATSSPLTPPLFRASSPKTRAKRAAHTKVLMGMKQKAGVSAVVQGRELAFFRFGGEVFVVNARCPHQGGNLCEGEVGDIEDLSSEDSASGKGSRRVYVTCPVHKMQFDLRDGSVIMGNCRPLQYYRVRIPEVDQKRKFAPIEVGFDSLTEKYFGELLF